MGEWSDAMDDGVICRGCALPLGFTVSSGGFCPQCESERRTAERDKLGPTWRPDDGRKPTPR